MLHYNLSVKSGSRRFLAEVSRRLIHRGHELKLFSNRLDRETCFEEFLTIPVEIVPCRESLAGRFSRLLIAREAVKIGRKASQWDPDITLMQSISSWFLPYFYGLDDSAALAYLHVHPIDFFARSKNPANLPVNRWQKGSIEKVKAFVANSKYTIEKLREQGVAASIPADVAYYGVDHSKFYPTGEEENFLLALARIGPGKNFELAIKAMKEVKSNTTLVIAGVPQDVRGGRSGSEEYRKRLEALIRQLNLAKRVKIQIIRSDEEVVRLMQRCSIFLFPSVVENFGLVALEAMACGKPIVVANATSLPEAVGDAGCVVDCDARRWADAIDDLLENPSLRNEMGSRSLRWARRFTWANTVESLLDIFKRFV